ncbi:hypothetical protein RCL_jg15221.t1 [Rhizophagus clarus]|uniref:Uncharacterized protein n=1 Tax=Rhizophagus clarus TaxID=94130 RepID=A0A8H3QGS3_9GLOM|nr:hypothetical protein RCL_jg15221.t1 [Rhizophagus clarus]
MLTLILLFGLCRRTRSLTDDFNNLSDEINNKSKSSNIIEGDFLSIIKLPTFNSFNDKLSGKFLVCSPSKDGNLSLANSSSANRFSSDKFRVKSS